MDLDSLFDKLSNPPRLHSPVLGPIRIRVRPEDFEVEEIPSYLPSGVGEHLYLWMKKTSLSTGEMVAAMSRTLRLKSRDIGVAGQKDRQAVTYQFVSIPRSAEQRIADLNHEHFQVLSMGAHGNKLRTGHLRGNRFRIVLRPTDDEEWHRDKADAVAGTLRKLTSTGFPNYFGPQRFGNSPQTFVETIRRFRASTEPGSHRGSHHRRKFAASAVQSAIFNLNLAERVTDGTCANPQSGDVVCRRDGIRPFAFNERGDTSEADLIPMGPMPGPKMMAATGTVADQESAILDSLGLTTDDFVREAKLTPGTRRKMVEYPRETSAQLLPEGSIETRFELPAGSYATVVLGEICAAVR